MKFVLAILAAVAAFGFASAGRDTQCQAFHFNVENDDQCGISFSYYVKSEYETLSHEVCLAVEDFKGKCIDLKEMYVVLVQSLVMSLCPGLTCFPFSSCQDDDGCILTMYSSNSHKCCAKIYKKHGCKGKVREKKHGKSTSTGS